MPRNATFTIDIDAKGGIMIFGCMAWRGCTTLKISYNR